jgi:uncharacterized protein (DUF1684 family)
LPGRGRNSRQIAEASIVSAPPPAAEPTWLDLHDWRSRVAGLFRDRDAAHGNREDPEVVWARFRRAKDALFAVHRQSPLSPDRRSRFTGLHYFAYDPNLRVEAELSVDESGDTVDAPASGPEPMPLRRAAKVDLQLAGEPLRLNVFWIDVYGGGLFLPFRDTTSPAESYGAGRYLFDTVKGSSFEPAASASGDTGGYASGRIVLDFNYAYNPSCAYDVRWACPLAPRENWLTAAIRAGERKFVD